MSEPHLEMPLRTVSPKLPNVHQVAADIFARMTVSPAFEMASPSQLAAQAYDTAEALMACRMERYGV